MLFVVDGGKALDKAIRSIFGAKALIQRCRRHKERNVTQHVPEAERGVLLRRLWAAWAIADADQAAGELEGIARGLARKRPGAAASGRAGGHADDQPAGRHGLAGQVAGVHQPGGVHDRDHPRPRPPGSGEMALRRAAAGMLAAETQSRRVKGCKQLPEFARALEHATAHEPDPLDLAATA